METWNSSLNVLYSFPVLDAHVSEPFSFPPELPTPLAGQFVSPPLRTGASGHAWVSVDKQCHLHYEIIVAGLSKADDLAVNAHLHGLAEIGEMDDSSATHKQLLTGFYGSQVHRHTHPYEQSTSCLHSGRNALKHTLLSSRLRACLKTSALNYCDT